MDAALPPLERSRREAADRLLVVLVAAVLLVRVAGGFVRALSPPPAVRPRPPLAIDLAHDPPGRLVWLPGIGPGRAKAIVEDRRRHGPVHTLDDLLRIRGIGPATVRGLREAREVRVVLGAGREPETGR